MPDLNTLASECHAIAVSKGWYEQSRTIPELLMLVVSELAEGIEQVRDGYDPACVYHNYEKGADINKPEGFPIELADAIIRLLDMCSHLGIDIQRSVDMKMTYNRTRPHRHGNKKF